MKFTPDSEKMEAVGRLAGGAAHDFNNILGAIEGYASLMLNSLKQDSPLRPDLEEIRKAVARATSLTRKFFVFSLRNPAQTRACSLSAATEGLRAGAAELEKRGIRLQLEVAPDLPPCRCTPEQAAFMLEALLSNAADAMPAGGTVTVAARQREGFCALSVRDTGTGMPPETLRRLCEPFFTTKEKGKGAGLALAMVYGVVRQNGGSLEAESEPGKGAEITVLLPLAGRN